MQPEYEEKDHCFGFWLGGILLDISRAFMYWGFRLRWEGGGPVAYKLTEAAQQGILNEINPVSTEPDSA